MVNIYRTEFFARCPNNGVRIKYRLEIRTTAVIQVERVVSKVEALTEGFHEELADSLHAAFGGSQTLVADHHSVEIQTERP